MGPWPLFILTLTSVLKHINPNVLSKFRLSFRLTKCSHNYCTHCREEKIQLLTLFQLTTCYFCWNMISLSMWSARTKLVTELFFLCSVHSDCVSMWSVLKNLERHVVSLYVEEEWSVLKWIRFKVPQVTVWAFDQVEVKSGIWLFHSCPKWLCEQKPSLHWRVGWG